MNRLPLLLVCAALSACTTKRADELDRLRAGVEAAIADREFFLQNVSEFRRERVALEKRRTAELERLSAASVEKQVTALLGGGVEVSCEPSPVDGATHLTFRVSAAPSDVARRLRDGWKGLPPVSIASLRATESETTVVVSVPNAERFLDSQLPAKKPGVVDEARKALGDPPAIFSWTGEPQRFVELQHAVQRYDALGRQLAAWEFSRGPEELAEERAALEALEGRNKAFAEADTFDAVLRLIAEHETKSAALSDGGPGLTGSLEFLRAPGAADLPPALRDRHVRISGNTLHLAADK